MATLLDPDTLAPLDPHDVNYGDRVIVEAPSIDGHGTTFREATVSNIDGDRITTTEYIYPLNNDVVAYANTPTPEH